MTVELIQGLLLAFALMVILMSPYIRVLHALGFGKRIRTEGPESHYVKEGTPTMGGLLIVAVVIGIYFFLRSGPDASTFAPLAALAGIGALGAFDDYLNAKTGEGIRARQKMIWLTVVAFVAAWQIQSTYDITAIAVPFTARHQLVNLLAAVAAAQAVGVEPSGAVEVAFGAMRGEHITLASGVVVINDCYNANPLSMRAALDDLATQASSGGRRVAVLGDMLELGAREAEEHRSLGAYAASSGVDVLVAVGPLSRVLPEAFGGESHVAADASEAAAIVAELVRPGDVVLVKASRGIGLDRVVEGLRRELGRGAGR